MVRRDDLRRVVHVTSVGYNTAGGEVDSVSVTDALVVGVRRGGVGTTPSGSNELRESLHAELEDQSTGTPNSLSLLVGTKPAAPRRTRSPCTSPWVSPPRTSRQRTSPSPLPGNAASASTSTSPPDPRTAANKSARNTVETGDTSGRGARRWPISRNPDKHQPFPGNGRSRVAEGAASEGAVWRLGMLGNLRAWGVG